MKRFLLLFALLFATITWLQVGNEAHGAKFTATLAERTSGPYNRQFEIDITFGKEVSTVRTFDVDLGGTANDNDDVTVAVTNVGRKPTKTWRARITPTRSGTLTIEIGGNAVLQGADSNAASNQLSVTIDVDRPTVVKFSNMPATNVHNHHKGPFSYTVTFSEDVTFESYTSQDKEIEYSVSGSGKVYTVSVAVSKDSTYIGVRIQVPENIATDAAGNGNIKKIEGTMITFDTRRPKAEVYVAGKRWDEILTETFGLGIDFDESVTGFDKDDIILGGTATATVIGVECEDESEFGHPGAQVECYARIKPKTEGTLTFQLAENAATDAAGNGNPASEIRRTWSVDPVPPTVTLAVPEVPQQGPFDITITFSEDVTDFTAEDIDLDDGDAEATAEVTAKVVRPTYIDGSGKPRTDRSRNTYIAAITPTSEGDLVIYVPAGIAEDAAGNDNTASSESTVTIDMTAPTVTGISVPTTEQQGPFTITVTFSEPMKDFTADDVTVNGKAVAKSVSPNTDKSVYKVTIAPSTSLEEDVTFQIAADVATDIAGNNNTASAVTTAVHVDTIAPTVAISGVPTTEQNAAFDIAITFSEPMNDFTADDVTVRGPAAVTAVSANAEKSVYTVTITPNATSEGNVTFQVKADVAADNAGNSNAASAVTSSVHIDTRAPRATITGVPTTKKNAAFDITVTFSEVVNDFAVADDLAVTGAADVSLKKTVTPKKRFVVTITPRANQEGDVTVQVKTDAVTDAAGNGNAASAVTSPVYIDTLAPTATISTPPTSEQKGPFNLTIAFSELVKGFAIPGDLAIVGAADVSLKETVTPRKKFTVTITPRANQEGDVTVQVKANAVTDAAGNKNTAASAVTPPVHIDTIAPTVTISAPPTSEQKGPFDLTITFNEDVSGFAVPADLAIVGEATANLKATVTANKVFTVTITPNAASEGDVTVQVKANAVTDAAGNKNTAASAVTPPVHIDTIAPTVTISAPPTSEQKGPFDLTITFNEDVSGFAVPADLAIVGEATANLKATVTANKVFTVTITPNAASEGDVTVQVKANAVTDAAGNNTAASAVTTSVHIDTLVPKATITGAPTEIQLKLFSVRIEFLEDVTELKLTDIALSGDAAVETAVLTAESVRAYTLTITPHEDTDGNVIITVPADVVKDAALNTNVASLSQTVAVAPAWIPALNLRDAIRVGLGLSEGEDFSQSDLSKLTDFTGDSREIDNLTGLEHAINLTRLNLNNNDIIVVDALTDMTDLTVLELKGNSIADLTPLTELTKLNTLDLSKNSVVDVVPLAQLTSLTELSLANNEIRDVSPLVGLTKLITLRVAGNPIQDLTPLVGLARNVDITLPGVVTDSGLKGALHSQLKVDPTKQVTKTDLQNITTLDVKESGITSLEGLEKATKLTRLDLSGNSITDITHLQHLTGLTTLNLSGNNITDITHLAGLTNLTTLDISGNDITDITPLEDLTNLTTLNISDNDITDITPLEDLTALTALGLSNNPMSSLVPVKSLTSLTTLELSGNAISDLNTISDLTEIHTLNLSNNAITSSSLSAITGLTALTYLDLSQNKVTSLTSVANFTELITLNLSDNSINDVSPLTSLTALEYLYLTANAIGEVGPLAGLANLKTLRLAENAILNTAPLYPLTQGTSPIDIDITIAEYPPWDVNEDGRVNAADSALVTAALGQSGAGIANSRTDVNGDGTVDNEDLTLVTQHLDDTVGAAPSALDAFTLLDPETLETLDRASLKATLDRLLLESDGSLKYLRAIQLLQNVLAQLPPEETRLFANYPNPFNPETWIPYQLAKGSDVEISIYDARGVLVRHLSLGHQGAGYYTERSRAAYWDGKNSTGERVASGIYFYRLQADDTSLLRKMLILK